LQALQPSSDAAQELKLLTEDYQRQIRQQTRLVNQLTTTLKAYYPRALEIAELTTTLAQEFLRAYPTPENLTGLTERKWQRWARALPIGEHGITAPTLWARLGDAPGRWESFRHLQAQAGAVPVTKRSGKQQRVVQFRYACDKALRYVVDHVAFLSLLSSEWA